MVRSTLLFVGGMLVGAAVVGGVVAQRAAADPVRQCEDVAHRTPDASVLPPEPLPPLESFPPLESLPPLESTGTSSAAAVPASAGAGVPASQTIRTPAR